VIERFVGGHSWRHGDGVRGAGGEYGARLPLIAPLHHIACRASRHARSLIVRRTARLGSRRLMDGHRMSDQRERERERVQMKTLECFHYGLSRCRREIETVLQTLGQDSNLQPQNNSPQLTCGRWRESVCVCV